MIHDTARRWNGHQAETYADILLEGFQKIAENRHKFHSQHRSNLARDTDFSVHLIGQHYVVFKVRDENTIIIAGLFHKGMDIPERLKELQSMSKREIAAIEAQIDQNV